ncbi:1-acyl-sn-glycerol-3-phosphate acyltransferase [Actinomadura fibrosa]|uniref:1-acyl-sn-glycerol-3-phosphate acyltransferase n=1 Tax=Actinomadura fibrosa TaxID=111802 RepID=A0ABW2XFK4_9ACTN|nr:1-acyl-sn-glycerol-3-phosphate acyltransferase [Actinomadura fibrosa]
MPPPFLRRSLSIPLLFVLALLVAAVFPVVFVLTLAGGRRSRVMRFLWFALAWGGLESAAVLGCGRLWLVRADPDRHYDVIRRYVGGLYRSAQRRLGLRIEIEGGFEGDAGGPEGGTGGPGGGASGPEGDRPLIVLSRHAGPGDALLLVHHLMSGYRRRPRVVMKAQLQLDPCIDIAGNRLPNVFVAPGGDNVPGIGRLARDLGPRDAVVIFPEGGNFTPDRRRRAIRRLVRLRRWREASRAAGMRHLMPPRPGGVLAALDAAPGADVVFVAHVGLEDMTSVGEVWRSVPLTHTVRARWWRFPAEDVPRDREARIDWLYTRWEEADAWIASHRAESTPDHRADDHI